MLGLGLGATGSGRSVCPHNNLSNTLDSTRKPRKVLELTGMYDMQEIEGGGNWIRLKGGQPFLCKGGCCHEVKIAHVATYAALRGVVTLQAPDE